jgi:hypothetical protein
MQWYVILEKNQPAQEWFYSTTKNRRTLARYRRFLIAALHDFLKSEHHQ